MRKDHDHGIPAAAGIRDAASVMAYSHWLVMKAQTAGNLRFDGHTATAEERDITRALRELSEMIKNRLAVCPPEEVGDLLDCYDMTYRIAFSEEPDPGFIDRHRTRLLNCWKEGNRHIEESTLYSLLSPMTIRNCGLRDKRRYGKEWLSIRGKWMVTLKRHFRFPDATSYENYQRLALLMQEDLADCFNEDPERAEKAKRDWYEHNKVDDLSALGSQILRSYRRFANALYPHVLDCHEQTSLDNQILTELCTRTDLDPYDREAFHLALDHNRPQS